MMYREEILFKGIYVHSQLTDLVSVKQYIISKIKERKALLLRLSNDRGENLTALTLRVRQYNVKGEFIKAEKVRIKKLDVAPYSMFSPEMPVTLSDNCTEFRVDVINASYGDYTYDVIDGEAHIRYKKQKNEEKKKVNTAKLIRKLGGRKQSVLVKTLKAPLLLTVVCSMILMTLMCYTILQLGTYMYIQKRFTLEDFEYEFMTENKVDGPLRIVKYNGKAVNLEIPEKIEGYTIGSIAKGAFSSSTLRNITISGNAVIEAGAFKNFDKLQSVTLPEAETIGNDAFAGCVKLTTVKLGSSLKSIGDRSFSGCTKLTGIELPEGMTSIGARAFENCHGMDSLTIPSTVKNVGEGVVAGCLLDSLTVPYIGGTPYESTRLAYFYGEELNENVAQRLPLKITVTVQDYIPDDTFRNCSGVEEIDYVTPVTRVGENAFWGCESLTGFELTKALTEIGRNAFNSCSSLVQIAIPETVKEIREGIFSGCTNLSAVVIPDGVARVEMNAFNNCSSLTHLVVPNTVRYIEEGAFSGCGSLVDVTIPFVGYSVDEPTVMSIIFGEQAVNNIRTLKVTAAKTISDSCFASMVSLRDVELSNNLTTIGVSAFEGCQSLETVDIQKNVTQIGERAFYGCASLRSIKIPEGIETIEVSQYEGCSSLTLVTLPDSILTVKENAFAGCSSLNEIEMPESIESIGQSAFSGCAALNSITLPLRIKEISSNTFENCSTLASIALPGSVTSIGERAFANCSSLFGLTFSKNLETIGNEAFSGCSSLISFAMPATVKEIGAGILSGCESLESLTTHLMSAVPYENGESGYIGYLFDSIEGLNSNTPASLSIVTLSDIKLLSEGAFADCASVKTVNLPGTLTEIGAGAFRGCTSLSQAAIPDSVSLVGTESFMGCTSLESVTLSNQMTVIEEKTFADCTALVDIQFADNIKRISSFAFLGCEGLKNVVIPESVDELGYYSFGGCIGLETITTPFVGTTREGRERFRYILGEGELSALTSITVTDAYFIADYAFENLASVKEIILNDDVASVGEFAFSGCSSLESLTVPTKVTYIGNGAFLECTSLASLSIPFVGNRSNDGNGITQVFGGEIPASLKSITLTWANEIPAEGFFGCTSLEEVIIKSDITTIGDSAFENCYALKKIELPESVESIGERAFYECTNLNSFMLSKDLTEIGSLAFYNCFKLFRVYNNSEAITVAAGEGANGDVAYFALGVFRDGETQHVVTQDGFSFLQDNVSDNWYIVEYLPTEGVCVLPDRFEYNGRIVTEYYIPANMFRNDNKLVNVVIPGAVKGIGERAFYLCGTLEVVDIAADISSVPTSTFEECKALVSVRLPDSVTEISDNAFLNCSSLESVNMPTDLVTIGTSAFEGCYSIKEIYLPAGVECISDMAFYGCESLEIFEMSQAITTIGSASFGNCVSLGSIKVYDSLSSIGDEAFLGCTSLYEVYNLSSLRISIESYNNGCIAYYAYIIHNDLSAEPLHDVVIDNLLFKKSDDNWLLCGHKSTDGNVELMPFVYQNQWIDEYVIVRNAFRDSEQITSLVISNAVKEIGYDAFEGQTAIKIIDLSDNTVLTLDDIEWIADCEGVEQISFMPTLTDIPTSIIKRYRNLKSVSFEGNSNITIVPASAFGNMSNLETVVLPDSVTEIGSYAFRYCYSLSSIYLPYSLTYIGDSAFYGCISLSSIDMPQTIEIISDQAFEGCEKLEIVSFPSSITNIGFNAFAYCTSLNTVEFDSPSNLYEIRGGAFDSCSALENLYLPDGLTYIRDRAFAECTSLKPIVIPSTVEEIASEAFYNCENLYEIWNLSSIPMSPGESKNGCVARYAIVVHTSRKQPALVHDTVTENGVTFEFLQDSSTGNLYLYAIENLNEDWIVRLPKIDNLKGYIVSRTVSNDLVGRGLFVPYEVSSFDKYLFDNLGYVEIYFEGTEKEWYNKFSSLNAFIGLYTYEECKHSYANTWMYDEDGNITTGLSEFSEEVVRESTCTTYGIGYLVCNRCNERVGTYDVGLKPHENDGNGVCKNCKTEMTSMDIVYSHITTFTGYTFIISNVDEIVSNNQSKHNSEARAVFTADKKMDITISYSVSSEEYCDVFSIRHNGEEIVTISGQSNVFGLNLILEEGDTLTFVYMKDGSVDSGTDTAYIHSVTIKYLD